MKNFTPEPKQEISHVGDSRPRVVIYTDGGCHNPTGLGGWAALLTMEREDGTRREQMISGYTRETTSNRMELTAMIEALLVLKRSCHVHIVTDSQLTMYCALKKWKRKANKDLWHRYVQAKGRGRHIVTFEWVKGHNGHPENERVDKEATRRYRQLKEKGGMVNG